MAEEQTKKGKGPKFLPAPEVEELAAEMIKQHHSFLREAKISYIFRTGKWNKRGIPVPGELKLMSPYVKMLTGFDFGVIINFDYWLKMDDKLKRAVLDHILSFAAAKEDKDGNFQWTKESPTVSEFPAVIARHGAYNADLEILGNSFAEYKKGE